MRVRQSIVRAGSASTPSSRSSGHDDLWNSKVTPRNAGARRATTKKCSK
jgi:hypothetical protein